MAGPGFSKGKTVFVLCIVIGCFAILWPKIFYPMLSASLATGQDDSSQQCCDVISEKDVAAVRLLKDVCGAIVDVERNKGNFKSNPAVLCRNAILATCGFDILVLTKDTSGISKEVKAALTHLRTFNVSQCFKTHFQFDFSPIGLLRTFKAPIANPNHMRPERPIQFRPDKMHPALREKGNAIPSTPPPQRTLDKEARPGPMPGVRPPIGGGAHVAQPAKGSGSMGIIMPLYTIGIVIFFVYTIMKVSHILFRKNEDEDEKRPCAVPLVKDFHRDSEHRKLISISPHDDYYTQRAYQEILSKEAKAQNTTWANKKRPCADNRRIDEDEGKSCEDQIQDQSIASSISLTQAQQKEEEMKPEDKSIENEPKVKSIDIEPMAKSNLTISTNLEIKPTEVKRLKSEDEWMFEELVTAEADTDLDFEAEYEKLTAKKPKQTEKTIEKEKPVEKENEEKFKVLCESEVKSKDNAEPTRTIVVEKESVKVEVDPEESIQIIIKSPEEIIPQISTNELGNEIEIVGIAGHNENSDGARDRDARDVEIDLLRKRLLETEAAMERIVKHMGSVSDRLSPTFMAKVLQDPTPVLKDEELKEQPSILKKSSDSELRCRKPETDEKKKKAVTIQLPHQSLSPDESHCEDDMKERDLMYAEELTNTLLKDLQHEMGKLEGGREFSVVGFEETVSLSDGGKWVEGRGSSLSPTCKRKEKSPSPPVPSIFLEGSLASGNYVVSNSQCEEIPLDYDADEEEDDDVVPVVLSGKVTLSVYTDVGENTEASSLSLDDPKFTSRDENNVTQAIATAMDENLKRGPDSTQIIPDIEEYEVLENEESEEEEDLEEDEEEEDDEAEIDDDTNYSTADAEGDMGDTAADISVLDGLEEKMSKEREEEE